MTTVLRALIEATGLSRRKAFAAIREGRVQFDGRVVTDPSQEAPPGRLSLDGEVQDRRQRARTYLLLNKPVDFVSTVSDERGRWTVLDLVPEELRVPGLHPVGRLDRDTSGLLILTNDGDLTFQLTHPSRETEKEYWVGTARHPSDDLIEALRAGVEIDGKVRRPLAVERLEAAEPFSLSIVLTEGRKRQVRRMLETLGARVTHLRRVREGSLALGDLPEGKVRRLSRAEVAALRGGEASRSAQAGAAGVRRPDGPGRRVGRRG